MKRGEGPEPVEFDHLILTRFSAVDRRTLRSERRARAQALWRERLTNPHASLAWVRSVSDRVRGTRTLP